MVCGHSLSQGAGDCCQNSSSVGLHSDRVCHKQIPSSPMQEDELQSCCQSRVVVIQRGMDSHVLELQATHTVPAPHSEGEPTLPPEPWAVGWPRGCGLHMDTEERASLGSAVGNTQQPFACALSIPLLGSPVCHSPREGQEGGVDMGLRCRCCRMDLKCCRFVFVAVRCNGEGMGRCRIRWCRVSP